MSLVSSLKNLLGRVEKSNETAPIPPKQTLAKLLHDEALEFTDTLVRVIYNADGTKRVVILRSESGTLSYKIEEIACISEDEWEQLKKLTDFTMAWWRPIDDGSLSVFKTEEQLLSALYADPQYKLNFK